MWALALGESKLWNCIGQLIINYSVLWYVFLMLK